MSTNKFWVEALSGTQLDNIPYKSLACVADFEDVVNGITLQDVQLLVRLIRPTNPHPNTSIIHIYIRTPSFVEQR